MNEILSSLGNGNLNPETLTEMLGLDGQALCCADLFEALIVIQLQRYSLTWCYWFFHQFSAIMHRQYLRVICASLRRVIDFDALNFQRQRPRIFEDQIPGVAMNQLSLISLQIVLKVCPVDINSEVLGIPPVERLGDLGF